MEPFLKKLAEHLIHQTGGSLADLCVVLPNRRAGLFLQQHLSNQFHSPVWLPEILSVEDFVFKLSRLEKADKLDLLLEFHRQYSSGREGTPAPLRQFLYWADPLLDDFNDLDYALADASEVFQYLSDVKAIEMWNPSGGVLSPLQEDYLHFYQSLGGLYRQLREAVLTRRMAWPGLAASVLGMALVQEEIELPWKTLCFAGLNAITPAEQKILHALRQQRDTLLLWDADRFYTQDPQHEAGFFLRKNKQAFTGPFLWEESRLGQGNSDIRIEGVPGKIAQAKLSGNILRQWIAEGHQTDAATAVVLADESLLLPVLNAIPPEIKDVNVTMGFSLNQSPAYRFFLAWLKLMEDRERLSQLRGRHSAHYRLRLLLPVLTHPWFHYLDAPLEGNAARMSEGLLFRLQKAGRLAVSPAELYAYCQQHCHPGLSWQDVFPENLPEPARCVQTMLQVVEVLRQEMTSRPEQAAFGLETEYLYLIWQQLNRLQNYFREGVVPEDLLTLRLLFERMLSVTQLPLSGEPLRGLQIMGMLETRALDFERVILLSVNEDVLPAGKFQQTFLPMEVRQRYRLPSGGERTAVAAYHFYRLLHHPSRVHIVYNTEVGGLGGGEKSRFIHQLLFELQNTKGEMPSAPRESGLIPEAIPLSVLQFDKDKDILSRLDALAEKGFSPSSLAEYQACPLRFYLSYLCYLRPEQEVVQEGSSLEVGDLLHLVLEYLYKPYLGKPLKKEYYREMQKNARTTLEKAFLEKFPDRERSVGKSLLLFEQSLLMLQGFLKAEEEWLEGQKEGNSLIVTQIEREEMISYSFNTKGGWERKIRLKGKADRIDYLNGRKRIVDYKSGRAEASGLKVDQVADLAEVKYKQAFQLLVYDLIFSGAEQPEHRLCILPLKKMKQGPLMLQFAGSELVGPEQRALFQTYLDSLLADIFDPGQPFSQTNDLTQCRNCNFKDLCYR
jgi:hypothetical protein